MKIIKTIVSLFKKLNSFKEIFAFISVCGEVLEFASQKFAEFDKTIE